MKRILAVGAHPDDIELGCGATLAKHALAGDEVHLIHMADGVTSRPGAATADVIRRQEQSYRAGEELGIHKSRITHLGYPDQRMDSSTFLDIVQVLEEATARINPQIVYTHFEHDLNIDHQITCRAVKTAFRPHHLCSAEALYSFETPSSTEWNFGTSGFDDGYGFEVVNVEGIPVERKFLALNAYKSEMCAWPHPRSALAIQAWVSSRGSRFGFQVAEVFKTLWRKRA